MSATAPARTLRKPCRRRQAACCRRARARAAAAPSRARARSRRPAPRAPRRGRGLAEAAQRGGEPGLRARLVRPRAHRPRALDRPLERGRRLRRAVLQQPHRPDAVGDRPERARGAARAPPRSPRAAPAAARPGGELRVAELGDHVRDLREARRRSCCRAASSRSRPRSSPRSARARAPGGRPARAPRRAPAASRAARSGCASRSKTGACGPSSPRSLRSESVLAPWNWAWIGESSRPSASSRSPRSNISRAIRAPRS